MKTIKKRNPDFSGIATKAGVKCLDGRTIRPGAFAHNDGKKVPLIWQHGHGDVRNVVGHVILHHQPNGDVRADGFINNTEAGLHAKEMVHSEDIDSLSIFANQVKEDNQLLVHYGDIKEVSLVLSGANPGAKIDFVQAFEHSDYDDSGDSYSAVMYFGETIQHNFLEEDEKEETEIKETMTGKQIIHGKSAETVGDILETLNTEQKEAVAYLFAQMINDQEGGDVSQSDNNTNSYKGEKMHKNAFTHGNGNEQEDENGEITLSHSELGEIIQTAITGKASSLKDVFIQHAQTYGLENIDILFPNTKTLRTMPDEITRDQGWVSRFVRSAFHSPFSRIKSTSIDLTVEQARAYGYIKGTMKKEDFFTLAKRETVPTTIYVKRKMDRDDVIDTTDFDVILWQKGHMRMMLDEEIARAGLIGDGREPDDDYKIKEDRIRPVYKDDAFYAHRELFPSDATTIELMDGIVTAQKEYKGTRSPVFFTTTNFFLQMLLVRDGQGRRFYQTRADVAAALNVSDIVEVPLMETISRDVTSPAPATLNLLGILLNPTDYTFGADKGGSVSTFDDFNLDYNQYLFLMETRLSGALTKPKSALIIEQTAAG